MCTVPGGHNRKHDYGFMKRSYRQEKCVVTGNEDSHVNISITLFRSITHTNQFIPSLQFV